MSDFEPNTPRVRLNWLDLLIGVAIVVAINIVVAMLRWMPDWLSVALSSAVGVALWYFLVLSRKKIDAR